VALAQKQLADELLLLGAGQEAQGRRASAGEAAPGGAYNRLGPSPGSGHAVIQPLPGTEARVAQQRDVLSAAANPLGGLATRSEPELLATQPRLTPAALPAGGPLELPQPADEGPEDGLTLDAAVTAVVDHGLSLRAKFQEIPKATADVLTAGLRGNPLVFASVDNAPYGQYSPSRPGETGYGITVIQPIDINHKRAYRVIAAERARCVVHAQYQDAVRVEIDDLYTRYVDVLATRETLRYVDAAVVGLQEVRTAVERLVTAKELSTVELDRIDIQIEAAALAKQEALTAHAKAKQSLAEILARPAPEVMPFDVRGTILTDVFSVPVTDQLVDLAMVNRPDLRAFHLGMSRAAAEVDLAVKERYPDVFVLYTPWGLTDNSAIGGRNAESWGVSGMASVPLFNRNQGNIRRAQLTGNQTRIEWELLQRRIESEVRQTAADFQAARDKAERLEKVLLPRSSRIRDLAAKQLKAGQIDTLTYLATHREYVDIVRQYRDALISLRRASLRINTVAGVRIVY
jgi:cobalt-zinc-cadmium efflux system outer membrane protein